MDFQSKTPVSYLQELCVKRQWTPEYTLLHNNNTGPGPPIFTYELVIDQRKAECSGSSKKEAKQNVANSMLNELLQSGDSNSFEISKFLKSFDIKIQPVYEVAVHGNAVGQLEALVKAYCDSGLAFINVSGLTYENTREEGPAHVRQFTVKCTIYDISKKATAGTKKQAKQLAAAKMKSWFNDLVEFQDMMMNSLLVDDDEGIIESSKLFPESKPDLSLNLDNLNERFNINTYSKILTDISVNYEDRGFLYNEKCILTLLKEILFELKFNFRINYMGKDGYKFVVAITIEIVPEVSCPGFGKSKDRAIRNASRNVIRMLCKCYDATKLPIELLESVA